MALDPVQTILINIAVVYLSCAVVREFDVSSVLRQRRSLSLVDLFDEGSVLAEVGLLV